MTKENVIKLLERSENELVRILLDEARKLVTNPAEAELLAKETMVDLKLQVSGIN